MSKLIPNVQTDSYLAYGLVITSFVLVLIFDLSVELGVAGGVPYILPVLLSLYITNKQSTYTAAALGITLTVVGLVASPMGGEYWKVLTNRALAIFAIVSVSIVVILVKTRNVQLQEKMALAMHANEVKSVFLSSMSHELRTPLNLILGYSQFLLLHDKLNEEQKESVSCIYEAGQSLLSMVESSIDFATLRDNQKSLSIESVALLPMIETILQSNKEVIADKKLQVDITALQQFPVKTLKTDATLLKEVLSIIIENAVVYNVIEGAITVQASLLSSHRLRILIEDTGEGINDEDLSLLFQPFARLGKENSSTPGLGLDLARAKLMMETLSGDIDCYSENNSTIFFIDLPLK
jgi:signal transduction histidine kinase